MSSSYKNVVKSSLLLSFLLIITGCGGVSPEVQKQEVIKRTSDTEKAYVSFFRQVYVGGLYSPRIVEFNPSTKELKLITEGMGSGDKIIVPLNEGIHYFYITHFENDDMIKVNVKKNHIYYIEAQVGMGLLASPRFYFNPFKQTTYQNIKKSVGKKCSNDILQKYSLELDEESSPSYSKSKQYNGYGLSVECTDNIISQVNMSNIYLIQNNNLVDISRKDVNEYAKTQKDKVEIFEDYSEWTDEQIKSNEVKPKDGFILSEQFELINLQ